jgi:Meckel syndrome type 1 protein
MVEVVHLNAQTLHFFVSIPLSNGIIHEELIGIIRVFPGGRIDVRPPFSNKANMEYKFFTPTNDLIRYSFNVIENYAEGETPFEHTLLSDIKRRRAIFEAGQAESSLAQPPEPPGTIRMFYRGQVAYANMENAEGVAVEYELKLPSGWNNEESGLPVRGCSQYSLCNDQGIANINLPIDLVARCQSQVAPTLQLTLHSFTPEGARMIEGYGSCSLPMTRGSHEIVVNLWRIRGRITEEMRLIYLHSGLEQQEAVEVPEDEFNGISADAVYNKFGLRTIGTGKLVIRFNLAMQSSVFSKRATTPAPPGQMPYPGSSQASRMSLMTRF